MRDGRGNEGTYNRFGWGRELDVEVTRNKKRNIIWSGPRMAAASAAPPPFPRGGLGGLAALETASRRNVCVDSIEGHQQLCVAIPAVRQVDIGECPVRGENCERVLCLTHPKNLNF